MANFRIAAATRNALAAALRDQIDADAGAGTIKIYSGTQPATADTALSGNTLLATFTLDDPSFGAGTATFARVADNSGDTVFDCDVSGTGGGGTLQLNTTTVSVGVNLSITSGTVTMPAG
jgi:hypothetical protein